MDFATALKGAREQIGLTQTELGKALHVSFSTINRYENGRHMPTPIILDAMKSFFEKNHVEFKFDQNEAATNEGAAQK